MIPDVIGRHFVNNINIRLTYIIKLHNSFVNICFHRWFPFVVYEHSLVLGWYEWLYHLATIKIVQLVGRKFVQYMVPVHRFVNKQSAQVPTQNLELIKLAQKTYYSTWLWCNNFIKVSRYPVIQLISVLTSCNCKEGWLHTLHINSSSLASLIPNRSNSRWGFVQMMWQSFHSCELFQLHTKKLRHHAT